MKRLENNLIEGIEYKYDKYGKIDWRKLIPVEYLYVNSQNKDRIEKKYGKPYNEIKVEDAEDKDLVITLGGIRYLLDLVGYTTIHSDIHVANTEYAAVTCSINFLGNPDTNGQQVHYSANACAHHNNTENFAKLYLVEMASNRALCRAVRGFCNINIVSREEIQGAGNNNQESELKPQENNNVLLNKLQELMKLKNKTFEDVRKKFCPNDDNIKELKDIPPDKMLSAIELLKKLK